MELRNLSKPRQEGTAYTGFYNSHCVHSIKTGETVRAVTGVQIQMMVLVLFLFIFAYVFVCGVHMCVCVFSCVGAHIEVEVEV